MTLQPGTHIGPYEIVAAIGAGGMGEVYRAHDPRLGRDVAIKVLTPAVRTDPDRLRRFEQEARAAAALNHPNILAVYDVGTSSETPFVVSELLEGHTLRQALSSGALHVRTAVNFAAQSADALAAAHARGIVHRDLKPENLFVTTDGRIKVLDFGLAKLTADDVSGEKDTSTRLATETMPGTVLGTAGYMSPEQASGRLVTFKSDQFSLGTVLYEMLTGDQPFRRQTIAQTMTAVIENEPRPITAAVPQVPPSVVHVLSRCLEKDPDGRFASTLDLARDLHAIVQQTSSGPAAVAPPASRRSPLLIAMALVAAIALVWGIMRGGHREGSTASDDDALPTALSQVTSAGGIERFPAWSPDGTKLAYSAESGAHRKLFVRTLASGEDRQLTRGDADDLQPAWSADGRAIAFVRSHQPDGKLEPGDVFGIYDGGDVWTIDVASGVESKIVDNAYGPSFSPDGQSIAVDASWAGPRRIWTVDRFGHNPKQVSSDTSETVAHYLPRWSPDGKSLVFQVKEATTFDIKVVNVSSGASQWLTHDAVLDVAPAWSPSGRAIYFSSQRGGGINLWRMPVDAAGTATGPARQVTTGAGQDVEVAVAPDARRLAFVTLRQNADLWELPLEADGSASPSGPKSVVATSREDSRGSWSPDGRTIAFNSDRAGDMNIWLRDIQAGRDRQLTRGPGGDYQPNWSPDGRTLAFFSSRSGAADIWTVDVASGTLTRLTQGPSVHVNPFFSPDGRFIAYQSDQDGRLSPWVMTSDGRDQRQLTKSAVGGHFMRWSRDGSKVIFRLVAPLPGGRAQLMQVPIAGGEPEPFAEIAGGSHFSFSPDYTRIVDVVGHKSLWLSRADGHTAPIKLFEFSEADARIDYPVLSPDGRRVLFDRFQPQGGDIWMLSAAAANGR